MWRTAEGRQAVEQTGSRMELNYIENARCDAADAIDMFGDGGGGLAGQSDTQRNGSSTK